MFSSMKKYDKTKEELIKKLEESQKNAEVLKKELEEIEEKFRVFFENTLEIFIIIDGKTGQILHVNKPVSCTLGYDIKDLSGKHYSILFPVRSEILREDRLEHVKIHDAVIEYHDVLRSDGSVCPMDITITVIDWNREKAILVSLRNSEERKKSEEEKEKLLRELEEALKNIKILGGLLPICASCKKIRDDKGYWLQLEEYIQKHSQAEFTHSICPDCRKKLYPEI